MAETVDIASQDADMNAAIEDARKHLPIFLSAADRLGQSDEKLVVKWGKTLTNAPIEREHIWVTLNRIDGTTLTGTLDNQPENFPGAIGDEVAFDLAEVSDWMIIQGNGKMQGAWTLRVLLPEFSQEDQDYFQSILLPLPN